MNISKLIDLKKVIGRLMTSKNSEELPVVITYNRGLEFTKYRITIEEIEEDFFVDSRGTKWMKMKDVKGHKSEID